MKVRVKFQKYGALRFIGHLDVMRYFQKVLRRAEIPVAFTGGYSPHMVMSFASPLGIGLTSQGEYFDMELTDPIGSAQAVRRMNSAGVPGITVTSFRRIPGGKKASGMAIVAAADYLVWLRKGAFPRRLEGHLGEQAQAFLAQPEITVCKKTKRSEKLADIRPLIYRMEPCTQPQDPKFFEGRAGGTKLFLRLAAGSAENLKPELAMSAFLSFLRVPGDALTCAYHRMELYADTRPEGEPEPFRWAALEDLGEDIPGSGPQGRREPPPGRGFPGTVRDSNHFGR